MLDTFYQWLVVLLPFMFAVGIELCSKSFRETRRYKVAVLVCGTLFSAITYIEMDHERRKSTREREDAQRKSVLEREAAIQETSVRVAARTSASVSDVLGRQFAENLAEVRSMRQATVASTAEVHALFEQNQTGKQKRQEVKDHLHGYLGMNNSVLGPCGNVSPPGHGGSSPQACINDTKAWVDGARGYISGSLGELYLHRFEQTGLRHIGEPPATGIDSNLDPYTRAEVSWAIYELKAKADVLQEFIKELGQ